MASQLLYAALLLGLCVLIHVTGTVAMARAFKVCGASTAGVPLFRPVLGLAAGFVLDVRSADLGGRLCCAQRDRRSRRSCLLLHCDLYDGRLRRRRAAPRLAHLGGLRGSSRDLALRLVDRPAHRLDPTDDAKHNHLVQCCWLIILFAGYGFIAVRNATVMVLLFACTLSVSGGVFLIQDWRSLSGIDPGVERAVARRDYSTRSINRYRASRRVRDEGEG